MIDEINGMLTYGPFYHLTPLALSFPSLLDLHRETFLESVLRNLISVVEL